MLPVLIANRSKMRRPEKLEYSTGGKIDLFCCGKITA